MSPYAAVAELSVPGEGQQQGTLTLMSCNWFLLTGSLSLMIQVEDRGTVFIGRDGVKELIELYVFKFLLLSPDSFYTC
jgi:hypothetical protein